MGDKGGAIALIAEAPDRAGLGGLELLTADFGHAIGEIGDGVEPLDGKAREPVHDHPFGGRGPGRRRQAALRHKAYPASCPQADKGYSGAKGPS